MRTIILGSLGDVPVLGAGLLLLLAAAAWSELARRRSDRRLARLLGSEFPDVRRYAVQTVVDPSRHAATLLDYRLVEADRDILRLLAEHVQTCRWSRSQSPDWLALRLWAFSYAPVHADSPPLARSRHHGDWDPAHRVGSAPSTVVSNGRVQNGKGVALDLAVMAGLAFATWTVGLRAKAFSGYPKGYDALNHLATIRLVLDSFPHLLWNYAWYGGFPAYPGSYPPFYTLFVAAGVAISGSSISQAMDVATAAIYITAIVSLYAFVRLLGRRRLMGITASLILLGAPTLWSATLADGSYPRLFAMAFIDVATVLAAWTARRPTRVRIALTAFALAIALGAHPVVGAIGVLQVVAILLAVSKFPFERRLRLAAGVVALVVGLSAWFYIPYVLRPRAYYLPPAQPALTTGVPAQIRSLVAVPAHQPLAALPAVLVPLTILLAIVIAILLWRPRQAWGMSPEETRDEPWQIRRRRLVSPFAIAGACLVPVAFCLGYAYVDYIPGLRLTFNGVFPYQILTYAVWPFAAAFGIALAAVLALCRQRGVRLASAALVVALAVGNLAVTSSLLTGSTFTLLSPSELRVIAGLPKTNDTLEERIAGTEDLETTWTSARTRTPEIRGGFVQGILNLSDQTALEDSLKNPLVPSPERSFMVDWYAIKWIYAPTGAAADSMFGSQVGTYRLIQNIPGTPESTYEVIHPTPILSASSARATLVIGTPEAYALVLQDFALGATPSALVVPVEGTQYVDDYRLSSLEQFRTVVLYDFAAHSVPAAASLLDDYVRHGGQLVIDVAGDMPLASAMSVASPRAFPVSLWQTEPIQRQWRLSARRGPLTAGVDFAAFSPANYAGTGAWLTEIALKWRRAAQVVLSTQGHPVILAASDGKGTVVESGMNLPYHAAAFNNLAEGTFLKQLIEGGRASGRRVQEPSYRAQIDGADFAQVRVASSRASGVLFKENDYPDWHATINGKPAEIFPAGPGMMYVPLPHGGPVDVEFAYRLSSLEVASTGITLVTALLLLMYLLVPGRALRWAKRRIAK